MDDIAPKQTHFRSFYQFNEKERDIIDTEIESLLRKKVLEIVDHTPGEYPSSFSLIGWCVQKIREDQARAILVVPAWTTQSWFTVFLGLLIQDPIMLPRQDNLLTLAHNRKKHPLQKRLRMIGALVSGKPFENSTYRKELQTTFCVHGNQAHTSNMLPTSGRWHQFCLRRKVDCVQPNVRIVLDFLTTLYEDGLSYSVINTARCALSQIIIWQKYGTIGAHPLVIKFMKGVFNLRPPVPRYTETWDVGKLLNKFRDMTPTEMLSLKELTLKTVTLVAIVLAARAQTISLLNLNNMKRSNSLFVFMVGKADLKQSRPNYTPPLFKLEAYPDRDICVYTMLTEYIARTSTLRGEGMQLFISYSKPHAKVSAATIARWVKTMMAKADINVHTFKPHSLRAASTSKALGAGVSLPEILHTAGWSSQHTFAKF